MINRLRDNGYQVDCIESAYLDILINYLFSVKRLDIKQIQETTNFVIGFIEKRGAEKNSKTFIKVFKKRLASFPFLADINWSGIKEMYLEAVCEFNRKEEY